MTGQGYISARVISELITPSVKEIGVAAFAARCGLSESYIRKICSGIAKTVHPYRVDSILLGGLQQPELWYTVPELAEANEAYYRPRWIVDARYRKGGYWR